MQVEHEADHSSLSSAKVKNEWSYTSFPCIFYDMHRYSFTFTVNVHIMKVLYVKFLKNIFNFKDMY